MAGPAVALGMWAEVVLGRLDEEMIAPAVERLAFDA